MSIFFTKFVTVSIVKSRALYLLLLLVILLSLYSNHKTFACAVNVPMSKVPKLLQKVLKQQEIALINNTPIKSNVSVSTFEIALKTIIHRIQNCI